MLPLHATYNPQIAAEAIGLPNGDDFPAALPARQGIQRPPPVFYTWLVTNIRAQPEHMKPAFRKLASWYLAKYQDGPCPYCSMPRGIARCDVPAQLRRYCGDQSTVN